MTKHNPKCAMIALILSFGLIYLIATTPTPYRAKTLFQTPDWKAIQEAHKFTIYTTTRTTYNKNAYIYLKYKDNEGYDVKELVATINHDDKAYKDIEANVSPYFKQVKEHSHTTLTSDNASWTKIAPSPYQPKINPIEGPLPPNPNRLPKTHPFNHDSPWIK